MPKFFTKSNVNTQITDSETSITPADLIKEHTLEVPANTESTTEFHIPEFHQGESSPQSPVIEKHPDRNMPTEITFQMPQDEEPLLPSPLDTPELTEHAGVPNSEQQKPLYNSPVPNPQSVTNNNFPQAPYTETLPPQGFNGYPISESKLVQTLMSWRAPSRPHRKKNRSFYTTVAILIILIAMISLLAGERMLVAVLFALMFLVYVLNFIEPGEVDYKISTQGVTIDEHFYHWQELDSFWFENKDGYSVLHILTDLKFPSMLMIVLGPDTKEEDIRKTVARFLPYHEIAPKSAIEKLADSLQRYFPLENPHK